jgi:histidinol-phosphate aminotransferase
MTPKPPAHLKSIAPYVPGKPIEEAERELGIRDAVKLASNENPLGPSPRAVEAIREAASLVNRYPDGSGHALRRALAGRHGLPPEQIVLGNGSTELLELLAKAYLADGRQAVVSEHAFVMYRLAAQTMAAPVTAVPAPDGRHDVAAMAAACTPATALVFIGNPNNPTGTYVRRSEMRRYFEAVPAHVLTVLDEAYIDYVEARDYPDGLEFLRAGRAVAVLRTFSKIHGLAGMRIGYALAPPDVALALEAVRSPFNTSIPAQAAALAALSDEAHVSRSRAANAAGVRLLQAELSRRGLEFLPTVANFVLLRAGIPGDELYQRLLRRGIIVRPAEAYGYPDAVRVSVGTDDEIRRFLEALDRSLADRRKAPITHRARP